MKQRLSFIVRSTTISVLLLGSGCGITEHPVPPRVDPPGTNAPAIRAGTDTYAFAVTAHHFTLAREQGLDFSAPQYALIATVEEHAGGTVTIEIRDDTWRTLRSETLRGDTVLMDSALTPRHPAHVTIIADDFTGRVQLTVRGCGPVSEMHAFQFPLEPGNTWTYRVRRSGRYDTTVVTICPDSVLPGGARVRPWKVQSATEVEWMFAATLDDTVRFLPLTPYNRSFPTPHGWDYCPRFTFPLRVGRGWRSMSWGGGVHNYYPGDPMWLLGWASVTAAQELSGLGTTYPLGFRVDQWPFADQAGAQDEIELSHWFVAGVGIVRIEERIRMSFTSTWELIRHTGPGTGGEP